MVDRFFKMFESRGMRRFVYIRPQGLLRKLNINSYSILGFKDLFLMIKYKKPTEKDCNIINNVRYIIDESNSDIFSILNTNMTNL